MLIGKTPEKSKNGKYCYMFVETAPKDDNGLLTTTEAFTFWTEENFEKAVLYSKFDVNLELFGDNVVIRSAKFIK